MRVCAKENCKNRIPVWYIDEKRKKHNCQTRKYCFECSPYGQHNTKNLNKTFKRGVCKKCGCVTQKGYNKSKCFKCYFNEKKEKKIKKVYDIIKTNCWYCNYDKGFKGISILEFHHINPETKLMGLTTREFVGRRWSLVLEEMQKCVSLCCRCHREYHAGLIPEKQILKIYKEKWDEINKIKPL